MKLSQLTTLTVLATSSFWAMGAASLQAADMEKELNIVSWAGYIERGETDKNYDWVTGFEKETGCKVNVKTAASSDEMVALMNQGGFDLVTASGDASMRLIKGGKVQAIDVSKIPNWAGVDKRLQDAVWHTIDGKHYGTPYQWGPNVLMYNTKVFPEAPKSWSVVFDEQNLPDGKSNKGRVQAYYGGIYVADAALYLMHSKPELGIKNPYELNKDQYAAAIEVLTKQRALVGRYWSDAAAQVEDFKNEGIVAAPSWPFQVNTLQIDKAAMEKTPVASTVPVEGATGWADTTMMHVDAAHPNCAYAWLDHSLTPKVQGDVAAWFGSVPAVPAACKGNELLTDAGCEGNGFANFDKIWFWRTPTAKCEAEGSCVPYSQWAKDYLAVQGK
jgi:putative spermidine/putrescine transport system substrate-binding protein